MRKMTAFYVQLGSVYTEGFVKFALIIHYFIPKNHSVSGTEKGGHAFAIDFMDISDILDFIQIILPYRLAIC